MEDYLLIKYLKEKGILTHDECSKIMDNKEHHNKESVLKSLYNTEEEVLTEIEAINIVEQMWHIENNEKCIGEFLSMEVAKDAYNNYNLLLDKDITHLDIYVAINYQYHTYNQLFKAWFGNTCKSRLIESAIINWFKDDDYDGNKLWDFIHND